MDKYSLPQLKKLVKDHKKSVPMLSSGKASLMMYAIKHKLVGVEEHIEMAKKDLESAESEVKKVLKKKAVKSEEPKKEEEKPKKKMSHNLSEVQRIRKEKGVSLKEAWALYLGGQKK